MGRPSSRAPERSRSLMVVTVTVWLGWSYCTDSVFAVTSRSSSSASSVQGGCRTRPQPQDTSKQAPAHTPPLTPALECNGSLYSIECTQKSLAPEPGLQTSAGNDPTPPFMLQGHPRPPGPHLDPRSCCHPQSLQASETGVSAQDPFAKRSGSPPGL